MTSYFYSFNVPDTTTGVPVPEGYPALNAVSGSWRVLSGKANTSTPRDQSPILAATLGTGSVDVSSTVGYGGDAIYVRVQDAANWIRARTRRWDVSSSYAITSYQWVFYDPDGNPGYTWSTNPTVPPPVLPGNTTPVLTGVTQTQWYSTTTSYYGVYLERCVNTVVSELGSATYSSVSTLRVRAVGTSVQVYVNGSSSPSISANIPEFLTVARHGIGRGPSEVDYSNLDNLSIDTLNDPPYAPVPVFPVNNVVVDRTSDLAFTWTFQDPNAGDSQSAYRLRYRIVGSSTWTETDGWISSILGIHTVSAGALVDGGAYEWQVATKDASGVEGPYSALSFFRAQTPPPPPSITDPLDGGSVLAEEHLVTWTASQQDAYQLQVVDAGTVVYDSGVVVSASGSHVTPFPENGVSRVIRLRVSYGELWSGWDSVSVVVAYLAPLTPLVSVHPTDPGVGLLSALQIEVSHPTPTPPEPTVVYQDVWVREVGEDGEGLRLGVNVPAGQSVIWHEPAHGATYEARVRAFGNNGTSTISQWVQATGPVVIQGFLLHDPTSPVDTLHWFRYNDSGAKEDISVESALMQYTGRTHPVAEFGEAETRVVEVPLIQSDLDTDDDWAWLRGLVLDRRPVVCYRDSRGRKLFGFVTENSGVDVHYGQETSLVIAATNYTEGA